MNPMSAIAWPRWVRVMIVATVILYGFLFVESFFTSDAHDKEQIRLEQKKDAQEIGDKEMVVRQHLKEHPRIVQFFSVSAFMILLWGLWLDWLLLMRWIQQRSWFKHVGSGPTPGWSGAEVFIAIVFLFLVDGVLVFLHGFLGPWQHWTGLSGDLFLILSSFLRDIALSGFVLWLIASRYGQGLRSLGLEDHQAPRHVREGLLSYIAMIPILLACFVVMAWILNVFSVQPAPQQVVQMYLRKSTEPFLMILTFFVAVIGPVMEEIFFRGFLYGGLKKWTGVRWGAVGSAAVFAALHMHWAAFFPIFVLGFFLAAVYEKTGSLTAPITAHVIHNTLMVSLTLGFKILSGPL